MLSAVAFASVVSSSSQRHPPAIDRDVVRASVRRMTGFGIIGSFGDEDFLFSALRFAGSQNKIPVDQ
jgi:hypothetical protein